MNNMEAAKKRRKGKCMQHVPFVLGVLRASHNGRIAGHLIMFAEVDERER